MGPRVTGVVPGRGQHGFTLVELLVAMFLALVIGGATLSFMVVTFDQTNNVSSRATATNQAEAGLEQLVRDLREAITSVTISNPTSTSAQIQFSIPTPGNDTTGEVVTWSCPSTGESSTYFGGSCTRALTPSGGTTKTKTLITGVQSVSFSPVSSSGSSLSLPVTSSTSVASIGITLTVQVTNLELGSSGDTKYQAGSVLREGGYATAGSTSVKTPPIVLTATADLRNFA